MSRGGAVTEITVNGRPIAVLWPLAPRSRWMGRSEFFRRFGNAQADAALTAELAELAPDTTDGGALR